MDGQVPQLPGQGQIQAVVPAVPAAPAPVVADQQAPAQAPAPVQEPQEVGFILSHCLSFILSRCFHVEFFRVVLLSGKCSCWLKWRVVWVGLSYYVFPASLVSRSCFAS